MARKEEIQKKAKDIAKVNRLAYPEVAIEQGFISGAEWADANPVHYDGKAYLYVLNKGVEQGRGEMLEKAVEWLKEHGKDYWWDVTEQSLEDFRKAMEE